MSGIRRGLEAERWTNARRVGRWPRWPLTQWRSVLLRGRSLIPASSSCILFAAGWARQQGSSEDRGGADEAITEDTGCGQAPDPGQGWGAWRRPGLPFLGPQGPWGPQVMLQRHASTLFLTRLQTGKDVIVQLSLKRCHPAGGPHQPW